MGAEETPSRRPIGWQGQLGAVFGMGAGEPEWVVLDR